MENERKNRKNDFEYVVNIYSDKPKINHYSI